MIKHAKTLRFYARLLRVVFWLLLLLTIERTIDSFNANRFVPFSLNFAIDFTRMLVEQYLNPLLFWLLATGFNIAAAVVEDMSKSKRQTTEPPSRPQTDEERFSLRKVPRQSEQPQPPRQKLENRPHLTPRLYSPRWQGGKAQRAARKNVIE